MAPDGEAAHGGTNREDQGGRKPPIIHTSFTGTDMDIAALTHTELPEEEREEAFDEGDDTDWEEEEEAFDTLEDLVEEILG